MKTGNASGAALSPGGGGWDGGERNEDGVRHLPCCWGSCTGSRHHLVLAQTQTTLLQAGGGQVEKSRLEMKK